MFAGLLVFSILTLVEDRKAFRILKQESGIQFKILGSVEPSFYSEIPAEPSFVFQQKISKKIHGVLKLDLSEISKASEEDEIGEATSEDLVDIISIANEAIGLSIRPKPSTQVKIIHASLKEIDFETQIWRFVFQFEKEGSSFFSGLLIRRYRGRQTLEKSVSSQKYVEAFSFLGVSSQRIRHFVSFIYRPEIIDTPLTQPAVMGPQYVHSTSPEDPTSLYSNSADSSISTGDPLLSETIRETNSSSSYSQSFSTGGSEGNSTSNSDEQTTNSSKSIGQSSESYLKENRNNSKFYQLSPDSITSGSNLNFLNHTSASERISIKNPKPFPRKEYQVPMGSYNDHIHATATRGNAGNETTKNDQISLLESREDLQQELFRITNDIEIVNEEMNRLHSIYLQTAASIERSLKENTNFGSSSSANSPEPLTKQKQSEAFPNRSNESADQQLSSSIQSRFDNNPKEVENLSDQIFGPEKDNYEQFALRIEDETTRRETVSMIEALRAVQQRSKEYGKTIERLNMIASTLQTHLTTRELLSVNKLH